MPPANVNIPFGVWYEPAMVGMGTNGVLPCAVGEVTVVGFPAESVTIDLRVNSVSTLTHARSSKSEVPASARPAGLYVIDPRSSAPATNAPARPIGRTPRSDVYMPLACAVPAV